MPAVSVIMNCYNSSKYLREAIASVYAQTFDDWEIVFWDNQSTDGSDEIARSHDGRLRYFRGKRFLPLGHARNEALRVATGEYVAFLDCDDLWLPDKLEKQVQLMRQRAEVGLVCSDAYIIDAADNITNRHFFYSPVFRGWVFDQLLFTNFIALPTVMMRRRVIDEVGDFKPYKIVEEYDLFLRCAAKYQVDYVNEPLAKYRVHAGNASRNYELQLAECLEIYAYWESHCDADQLPQVRHLLAKARAKAFLSAGKNAVYLEEDTARARRYYKQSFDSSVLAETLAFYALSYFGPRAVIGLKRELARTALYFQRKLKKTHSLGQQAG
jgi:glycosyltransferase involved in cell wall biosynthesis